MNDFAQAQSQKYLQEQLAGRISGSAQECAPDVTVTRIASECVSTALALRERLERLGMAVVGAEMNDKIQGVGTAPNQQCLMDIVKGLEVGLSRCSDALARIEHSL